MNIKDQKYNCTKEGKGIILEMTDICLLLSKTGKVSGYTNIINIEYVIDDIANNISRYDLYKAKSMLVSLDIGRNISLLQINNLMQDIFDICSEQCEILFGIIYNNDIDNNIGYKILLTGI